MMGTTKKTPESEPRTSTYDMKEVDAVNQNEHVASAPMSKERNTVMSIFMEPMALVSSNHDDELINMGEEHKLDLA